MTSLIQAFLSLWFALWAGHLPQQDGLLLITPQPGEVIRGQVTIRGTLPEGDLLRYEVEFTYQEGAPETWFPIIQAERRPEGDVLAVWDTTAITDGNYRLRIRAFFADGRDVAQEVPDLQLRNYTPVETPIPAVVTHLSPSPSATLLLTPTSALTPTPLPPNPAALDLRSILNTLGRGVLLAVFVLLALGLYRTRSRNNHEE